MLVGRCLPIDAEVRDVAVIVAVSACLNAASVTETADVATIEPTNLRTRTTAASTSDTAAIVAATDLRAKTDATKSEFDERVAMIALPVATIEVTADVAEISHVTGLTRATREVTSDFAWSAGERPRSRFKPSAITDVDAMLAKTTLAALIVATDMFDDACSVIVGAPLIAMPESATIGSTGINLLLIRTSANEVTTDVEVIVAEPSDLMRPSASDVLDVAEIEATTSGRLAPMTTSTLDVAVNAHESRLTRTTPAVTGETPEIVGMTSGRSPPN